MDLQEVLLLISGHLELEADCNLRIEVPTKLLSTLRVSTGTKWNTLHVRQSSSRSFALIWVAVISPAKSIYNLMEDNRYCKQLSQILINILSRKIILPSDLKMNLYVITIHSKSQAETSNVCEHRQFSLSDHSATEAGKFYFLNRYSKI